MKFKDLALRLRPKRSPIFWGLIALVLVFVTPLMLGMLGALFQFGISIPLTLIKGESLSLGGKITWIDIFPIFIVFLFFTMFSILSFSAMLCLIVKKYRLGSKLIIAAPLCMIAGTLLYTQVDLLGERLYEGGLPQITFVLQEIFVAVILYLYAKKYLKLENSLATA